ncbi:MAG: four-carbon acid sugar kinase family protein [bacterium]
MGIRAVIIADDLTGANDTGAQFAKEGFKTCVLFWGAKGESLPQPKGIDVVVVSTESRHLSPKAARHRVRYVSRLLREMGAELVYKKIDSTMRGNIGSEMDAAMDSFGIPWALVAPSFPAYGRAVVGGIHKIDGVPLAETEIARDPIRPVRESHVPTLIRSQTGRKVEHIDISTVRSRIENLREALIARVARAGGVAIVDAETYEDLDAVAEAAWGIDPRPLFVGSAGLASRLPGLLTPVGQTLVSAEGGREMDAMLVVSGSITPTVRRQIGELEHSVGISRRELSPGEITGRRGRARRTIEDICNAIQRDIEKHRIAVVCVAPPPENGSKTCSASEIGRRRRARTGESIVSALGEIAFRIVSSNSHRSMVLVLTGGDTTMGVCRRLGAEGIEIENEILPGIPLGRLLGGEWRNIRVVTKAGAFGGDDALVKIVGSKW